MPTSGSASALATKRSTCRAAPPPRHAPPPPPPPRLTRDRASSSTREAHLLPRLCGSTCTS
eukprot:scaffold59050_cov48-Phaeocystis_antarctica.AAC.1